MATKVTDTATGDSPVGDANVKLESNLAALLDRFTGGLADPDAHTIGSFADTVQALHAEFAMLARHFEAAAEHSAISTDPSLDAAYAEQLTERDEFGMEIDLPVEADRIADARRV